MALPTNIYAEVSTYFPGMIAPGAGISVSKSGNVWTVTADMAGIPLNSVGLDKLEQIAADRLLGADEAGDVVELTVSGGIEFTGAGGIQRSAISGDVVVPAGSGTATIQPDAITTAKIADGAVTATKIGADAVDGTKIADDAVDSAHIADDAVGLAQMSAATRGDLITYDANGDPAHLNVGSTGQVPTVNASGDLEYQTPPSAKPWTLTVFTASDPSWPVPANTLEMRIVVIGAGGSGASGNTSGQRGSGAGGGGFAEKYYSGTMDATLAIVIGAGGTPVESQAGGLDGIAGGDSSVTGANLGTITANGGGGGNNGVDSGGPGGAATGGDINISGEDGMTSSSALATSFVFAGGAAGGWGGTGGRSNVGSPGKSPGGGGACGNHTAAAFSGAGADGRVYIWTR